RHDAPRGDLKHRNLNRDVRLVAALELNGCGDADVVAERRRGNCEEWRHRDAFRTRDWDRTEAVVVRIFEHSAERTLTAFVGERGWQRRRRANGQVCVVGS